MRFRTSTAAACVLAAGLAAAGCTSASPGPSAGPATAPAAGAGPGTPAGSAAPAPAAATSAAASAPGTQANGGTCQAQNLSFALAKPTTGTPGQKTRAVDLTNTGPSACTLDGFPGVDLVGIANGQQDYTWSLVRQTASYSLVTLQPSGTAHFNLVYLPVAPGSSGPITVAKMVITPPNDFTQAEVTWNQPVLLQDGATHPGTYISPVMPGP
jgi:Protein of unknown function (DUF4232)